MFSIKTLTCTAALALVVAGSANAAVVWDFNDNNATVDSNALSGDGVTTDDVTFSTSGGTTASIASQRAQRDLGNAQSNETATFEFTLKIGATPISLTQIDFTNGLDVNAGSVNTNHWKWDLVITTTGSETPGASQTSFVQFHDNGTGPNEIEFSESATLSGLDNLTNVDVTFAFTGEYGTKSDFTSGSNSNRFVYLDDVTFTGEFIPEPASLALLGLGGLLLAGRQRGPAA